MARVTLIASVLAPGGVVFSPVAAETDGNAVKNEGNQFFYIKNGSGGAVTITFQTPRTVDGIAIEEVTDSLGAGNEEMYGVFSTHVFNQSNGEVWVDFSAVASVTIQAFKL